MRSTRRAAGAAMAALVVGVTLWAADPLTTLGISQREASEQLMSAVTAGNAPYGTVVNTFKKLSPAARAAVTQDAIAWAKGYTASAPFRAAYLAYRATQKPEAPAFEGSAEDEFKKKQAEQAADLAESRKAFAALPAEQRKQMEEVLKQSEAFMKTPEMLNAMRAGIVADRQSRQESFEKASADWRTAYPENPQPLIAKQLRRFLDASANVDFGAQLVSKNGSMRFADAQYEAKSGEWKMCYRAGREAVTVARAAAAAWLKEIDATK